MYITKSRIGFTKGQVTIKQTPSGGDAIVAGPFPDKEWAKRDRAYIRTQRHIVLGDDEEVRIHAPNGGYLFSVRQDGVFFDRNFTQQREEFALSVDMFPWNKKEAK